MRRAIGKRTSDTGRFQKLEAIVLRCAFRKKGWKEEGLKLVF